MGAKDLCVLNMIRQIIVGDPPADRSSDDQLKETIINIAFILIDVSYRVDENRIQPCTTVYDQQIGGNE